MRITSQFFRKVGDITKKFSNFPDSYIKRSMEEVHWRTPRGKPNYLPRTVERTKFRFTTNRPWTSQFKQQNMTGTMRKKVFLEPIEEWSYFKGDRVEVLVGRDKGKQGIVKQVIQERNWVIVEGLNCHLRKVGKDKDFPGVVIKSEAPLLVTNQVALVDPSDLLSTAFDWRYTEEGEKVRVSLRTGRIIPLPKSMEETADYKSKGAYVEREKDTTGTVASEITFEPKLCTFEMDIMKEMGIVEERIPGKTFWY
ncbi:putative 39S ribosomal protein L24, mitochondrial [Pseudolycoriella hygida]|uniref:Large ribosomal subunit protein uL24m n=1 Tax=Pseudolycoriella hygida TaxID=35572 RepID=A0A9Q0NGY9_9DIPT|nr:putative 39S ribosomal protein L24, mitochondrial [Pseudolycoriella hygida]